MKKFYCLILLLPALTLLGCTDQRRNTASSQETVRGLELLQVQRQPVPDYLESVGTVRPLQTSQLAAQIVGAVVSIHAQEGQRVHKGEVLIVLDDAQQRAGLERARAAVHAAQQDIGAADADYALANSTLGRYQSLLEKKSVSPHEMDEVQARARTAAARRDQANAGILQARALEAQAQAALGYTRIRAPFDGVVTSRQVDVGALAAPGTPLLTVEDIRQFRLEASVDESDVKFVTVSAAAPVLVDALDAEVAGKVAQIVPAADPASRSFVVKLDLPPDARWRSGLFGRARFARGRREALLVPRAAVLDRGQIQGVFVAGPDGQISLRYVTLGKAVATEVEVLSGLAAGERLVAAHGGRELAGKKVGN